MKDEDLTRDSFYHGKIHILQPLRGYRFSVDSPLLADFIQTKRSDDLLEMGTGNGIISLLLSIKSFRSITAIEIQNSLVLLAKKNVAMNHLEKKIHIVCADLRTFQASKKFDVVFSNPPYIRKNKGNLSSLEEKSIAKHELKCNIFDIMQRTSEFLKQTGRAYFIFPMKRKEEFNKAADSARLRIHSTRPVCSTGGSESNLFLCALDCTSESPIQLPSLVLFDEKGNHTPEAEAIFSGRNHAESL